MAKFAPDAVLDKMADHISTGNIMTVCSTQPTNRTEAVTTYALADVAMAGGDFTKADGDTSGRKVTVAAKSGILIDTSGTAQHIAICDATNLLYVTTCTSQAIVANGSNTVSVPAWKIELADPS